MNVDFECVCGDDVNRCDWSLEGMIVLVSRRKDVLVESVRGLLVPGPKKGPQL